MNIVYLLTSNFSGTKDNLKKKQTKELANNDSHFVIPRVSNKISVGS